jgi:hypothetical protein
MKKCKCGKEISKTKYKRCRKCSDKIHSIFMIGNNYFRGHKHRKSSLKLISKHHIDVTGDKNPNWQGGLDADGYPFKFNDQLKESIRKRDNYTCQKCNNFGNYVHHIDYDKENCKENNLIILCNLCNIKVNYNRKKWIKYFKKIINLKRR